MLDENFITEIKPLLSLTRIKLLKHLRKRRYTASELSRLVNLSVPTVFYHLSVLEKYGFVRSVDSDRKWKYYELTEKSERVLENGLKITLAILLITTAALTFLPRREGTQKPLGGEIDLLPIIIALVLVLAGYLVIKIWRM